MGLNTFARCRPDVAQRDARACHRAGLPGTNCHGRSGIPARRTERLHQEFVGEQFRADLKQPLIVENRPGAGGNIAAESVARSAGDGYTTLATIDTVVTDNPYLYKTLNSKADVDLVPVIYLAN